MARKATIIGTATDWSGDLWDVRESRPTVHDFDLLLGWPQSAARGRGGRGVAIILTVELADYLSCTRLFAVDLPCGRNAIKRMRADIGVRWVASDWWGARLPDLASLTLEQFCTRHGCSMGAASQWRNKLVNKDLT